MNTHTIVADIRQNMLKTREATDGQDQAVSDTLSLCVTEQTLTATQTQIRSAISTTEGSVVSHFHPVHLGNLHLLHRGSSLVVTN